MADNKVDNTPNNDPNEDEAKIRIHTGDGPTANDIVNDARDEDRATLDKLQRQGERIRRAFDGESIELSEEDKKALEDFREGYERMDMGDTDYTKDPKDQEPKEDDSR